MKKNWTQEQLSSVGWRGKVRFSDAHYIKGNGEDDKKTLHELLSPKLAHTIYYGGYSPAPGDPVSHRKFYYHHRPYEILTQKPGPRNVSVIPLKPGAVFEFDLWCDGLDDKDKALLFYALELEADQDGNCTMAHKIGHGKPVGLGSVMVTVIEAYQMDIQSRYSQWSVPAADSKQALKRLSDQELRNFRDSKFIYKKGSDQWLKDLRAILKWPPLRDTIGYPEWKRGAGHGEYQHSLPKPGQESNR